MGHTASIIMKLLLLLAACTLATAEWTCEDCRKLSGALTDQATNPDDIQEQITIVTEAVCPQVEDMDACVAGLPQFWADMARVMWPAVFSMQVWCPECTYGQKLREVTCDECNDGLHKIIGEFYNPASVQKVVDYMNGDAFCGQDEDPALVERCTGAVGIILPIAFPAIADHVPEDGLNAMCQDVFGVCAA